MPVARGVQTGSLALLTDLYQLTMASGYLDSGKDALEAVFHVFFRKCPFEGGYAVACGLEPVVEYLESWAFEESDLDYLATLEGAGGVPLFPQRFLDYLRDLEFECDVDAVPEGTVVFPHEPLLRISGPIAQCQILETPVLNLLNFQTLIATKASRVALAAKGDAVIEFGLRRAQGVDGGLSASRAAYVGGCAATSNVLAGKHYGIPVKGTHAHSWVMAFDTELEAFGAWADAMPHNSVFLVDTYDSLEGVRNAIEVGARLRERGHPMTGVRLDSGDLAELSMQARAMLDEAGFTETAVVASNELDETLIASLKGQGAAIAVWGVGTKLATADGQPSLGGVYKLSAIREPGGEWQPKLKVSEQSVKMTTPGVLQVRRFSDAGGGFAGDMVFDTEAPPPAGGTAVDPSDPTRRRSFAANAPYEDLLVPVFRGGGRVWEPPSLARSRDRALDQLARLPKGTTRLLNPHEYPAGLELSLYDRKTALALAAREGPTGGE